VKACSGGALDPIRRKEKAMNTIGRLDREDLLKRGGLASLALVSLPALAHALETPALAAGQTNFHFVVVSAVGGSLASGADAVILNGCGTAGPSQVHGAGSFTHFRVAASPPFPIVAHGTWKAKRLVSFELKGTYGAHAAGLLTMLVHLVPVDGPAGRRVVEATMRVVCNIGPAGLSTGLHEGVFLTVRGATFGPAGIGVTAFSTGVEERD
jgi:hypothetical protein